MFFDIIFYLSKKATCLLVYKSTIFSNLVALFPSYITTILLFLLVTLYITALSQPNLTYMRSYLLLSLSFIAISCTKQHSKEINEEIKMTAINATQAGKVKGTVSLFTNYTIQQGAHYCNQNTLRAVSGSSMNFIVKFDETAIYPAVITDYNHAYDVNKLYGFSEGSNNQYNSARIGWRWLNGELQLFAYVYVNGTLLRDPISYDPPYIKSVAIGAEVNCSIAVSGSNYIFTVDGVVLNTQRGPTTTQYKGYQQYPYYGGTLTAPHLINIYIK